MFLFLQGYKNIPSLALLLLIDTCFEKAYVALMQEDNLIQVLENSVQKEHALFVHTAAMNILKKSGYSFNDLDAIAVNAGPGSYTGIRVGLAAAKGFCFAAGKPLIILNTLQILAVAGFASTETDEEQKHFVCCCMIKARINEVYFAVYDHELNVLQEPQVITVDNPDTIFSVLKQWLNNRKIIVTGNGYHDFLMIQQNYNVLEGMTEYSINDLAFLSLKRFKNNSFDSISSSEPFYLKAYYTK